jgi:hypothetical protein
MPTATHQGEHGVFDIAHHSLLTRYSVTKRNPIVATAQRARGLVYGKILITKTVDLALGHLKHRQLKIRVTGRRISWSQHQISHKCTRSQPRAPAMRLHSYSLPQLMISINLPLRHRVTTRLPRYLTFPRCICLMATAIDMKGHREQHTDVGSRLDSPSRPEYCTITLPNEGIQWQ